MTDLDPKLFCCATDDGAVCREPPGHKGHHNDHGYIWVQLPDEHLRARPKELEELARIRGHEPQCDCLCGWCVRVRTAEARVRVLEEALQKAQHALFDAEEFLEDPETPTISNEHAMERVRSGLEHVCAALAKPEGAIAGFLKDGA